MKLLYLVPYTPGPIRIRSFQFLKSFLRLQCEVTLATLVNNSLDISYLAELDKAGVRVLSTRISSVQSIFNCVKALPGSIPLQFVFSWDPKLGSMVTDLLGKESFDGILVEHVRGAIYGVLAQQVLSRKNQNNTPIVWDSVDCNSHLHEQSGQKAPRLVNRLISRFEKVRTSRIEAWLTQFFDDVVVTSNRDQKLLSGLTTPGNRIRGLEWFIGGSNTGVLKGRRTVKTPKVIANGVDLEYYTPGSQERDQSTILMTGKMSYSANQAGALMLVNEIMPLVWKSCPRAKVQIVGKDPPRLIKQLQNRNPKRVEVTGYVPDIRPFLQTATIAVAPLPYAVGIQNKALEAMACATPLVVTASVFEGIHAEPDSDFIVKGNVKSFAKALVTLLSDPTQCRQIGMRGRNYVENNHSWIDKTRRLKELFYQLIQDKSSDLVR